MMDYEFGPPYEHSELDMFGIWNSADSASICFLVARDENRPYRQIGWSKRSSLLVKRLNDVFLSATVELKTVFEHPTTKEGHSSLIIPSEMYLEEPSEGIMLIEAARLKPDVEEPMEICVAATAEIYGDLMFERTRN